MFFGSSSFEVLDFDVLAASVMFLYTSYLDIRKREVDDKVWVIFGAIASISLAYRGLSGQATNWLIIGISIGLTSLIGMGLFFFGLYGGADGKALVVLSLFLPLFKPSVGLYSIGPLIVLTNGVLLSMVLPLGLLALNFSRVLRGESIFEGFEEEPLHRKVLACLLGYKQLGKPRAFQFSLEKVQERDKDSKLEQRTVTATTQTSSLPNQVPTRVERTFDFSLMRDDFEERPGTWVTPGIPLLVFFAAGFFALLLYGDLVIGLVGFFFGIP